MNVGTTSVAPPIDETPASLKTPEIVTGTTPVSVASLTWSPTFRCSSFASFWLMATVLSVGGPPAMNCEFENGSVT